MLLKTIPLEARIENQPYGIAGILYHGTEIYESWTTLLLNPTLLKDESLYYTILYYTILYYTILMRYAVKLIVLSDKLFYLLEKDSCEQSGVNTIESLQGFYPLLIGEFWLPFIRKILFQLS